MAKKLLHSSKIEVDRSNNTLIFQDVIPKENLLLITNVNANKVVYQFNDNNLGGNMTVDGRTSSSQLELTYDIANDANMSDTDSYQVFYDSAEVHIEPSETFVDPVSKFRVSNPENLIDTDFEYGLQSTKWETLQTVNNVPTLYASGGEIPIEGITSVTSLQTSRQIKVTVSTPHGLGVGDAVSVQGVTDYQSEGFFIVSGTPNALTFFYEIDLPATTSGEISGSYTTIIPAKFFEGAALNVSNSDGAVTDEAPQSEITVTTEATHGFAAGTKLYVRNSIGPKTLRIDDPTGTASDGRPFVDTTANFTVNEQVQTADTARGGAEYNNTVAYDWECTYTKYLVPGDIDSATNRITWAAHGLENNFCLLYNSPIIKHGVNRNYQINSGVNETRMRALENDSYSSGGNTFNNFKGLDAFGLEDGGVYYVTVIDGDTIELYMDRAKTTIATLSTPPTDWTFGQPRLGLVYNVVKWGAYGALNNNYRYTRWHYDDNQTSTNRAYSGYTYSNNRTSYYALSTYAPNWTSPETVILNNGGVATQRLYYYWYYVYLTSPDTPDGNSGLIGYRSWSYRSGGFYSTGAYSQNHTEPSHFSGGTGVRVQQVKNHYGWMYHRIDVNHTSTGNAAEPSSGKDLVLNQYGLGIDEPSFIMAFQGDRVSSGFWSNNADSFASNVGNRTKGRFGTIRNLFSQPISDSRNDGTFSIGTGESNSVNSNSQTFYIFARELTNSRNTIFIQNHGIEDLTEVDVSIPDAVYNAQGTPNNNVTGEHFIYADSTGEGVTMPQNFRAKVNVISGNIIKLEALESPFTDDIMEFPSDFTISYTKENELFNTIYIQDHKITGVSQATYEVDGLNEDGFTSFNVTNQASGDYLISGGRLNGQQVEPTLTLYRGLEYTFEVDASGHPFYFTTDDGSNYASGTYFGEYTQGVTGSRTDVGTVTFNILGTAPDTLYYACGNHFSMYGEINIVDQGTAIGGISNVITNQALAQDNSNLQVVNTIGFGDYATPTNSDDWDTFPSLSSDPFTGNQYGIQIALTPDDLAAFQSYLGTSVNNGGFGDGAGKELTFTQGTAELKIAVQYFQRYDITGGTRIRFFNNSPSGGDMDSTNYISGSGSFATSGGDITVNFGNNEYNLTRVNDVRLSVGLTSNSIVTATTSTVGFNNNNVQSNYSVDVITPFGSPAPSEVTITDLEYRGDFSGRFEYVVLTFSDGDQYFVGAQGGQDTDQFRRESTFVSKNVTSLLTGNDILVSFQPTSQINFAHGSMSNWWEIRFKVTGGVGSVILSSGGTGGQTFEVDTLNGAYDGIYEITSIPTSNTFKISSDIKIPARVYTIDNANVDTATGEISFADPHNFLLGEKIKYDPRQDTTFYFQTDLAELDNYLYAIPTSDTALKFSTSEILAKEGASIGVQTVGGTTDDPHTLVSESIVKSQKGPGRVDIVNGGISVLGNGTEFLKTFKRFDRIYINDGNYNKEFTVSRVLTNTELELFVAPTNTASNADYWIPTELILRPDGYGIHLPFDGGVNITAGTSPDSKIVRQTRKYFRYQSGKGIQNSFAINFNPPRIVRILIKSNGTTASIETQEAHNLNQGDTVVIERAEVSVGDNEYNGEFVVTNVVDAFTFEYEMVNAPDQEKAAGFPTYYRKNWNDSFVRAGMFDDQNGFFIQYDGQKLACVRRSSTLQLAGTINVTRNSQIVTGARTSFTTQLSVGNFVVIRGQSYKVVEISSDTRFVVQPSYRGVDATNVKCTLTEDEVAPQETWNIDKCDGEGPSGFDLDINRIQMAYADYSWYGAGKIRFGFKDRKGHVKYVHEFIHNNILDESYFRSGNLPGRYEIMNGSAANSAPTLFHFGTSVIMDGTFDDDKAYLFTANSKPHAFTNGASSTASTTDVSSFEVITLNGQRVFVYAMDFSNSDANDFKVGMNIQESATPTLPEGTYVTQLVKGQTNTKVFTSFPATSTLPSGSSFPQIVSATSFTIGEATSVDLSRPIPMISVRLAPSVDSSLTGDVGEREIMNRMQLGLREAGVTSNKDLEIFVVLNCQPSNLTFEKVDAPSLSQLIEYNSFDTFEGGTVILATKVSAGSTTIDLSELLELGNSILGGDSVFPSGPDLLTIAVQPQDTAGIDFQSPVQVTGKVSWSESQA